MALNALKYRKFLNVSRIKRAKFLDCTASRNAINDNSFKSKKTTQHGFISTGEISREKYGKKAKSYLDLLSKIKCTKNDKALSNAADQIKKSYTLDYACAIQGSLRESQCGEPFYEDCDLRKTTVSRISQMNSTI